MNEALGSLLAQVISGQISGSYAWAASAVIADSAEARIAFGVELQKAFRELKASHRGKNPKHRAGSGKRSKATRRARGAGPKSR